MIFKYRKNHESYEIVTINADKCHGMYPAYDDTHYWEFQYKGKQIASVAEPLLLKGYKEKAQDLYAKPFLKRILDESIIDLSAANDYDFDLYGGVINIWYINSSDSNWIEEYKNKAILRTSCGRRYTKTGKTFKVALRKLFPKNKIRICVPTTRMEIVP